LLFSKRKKGRAVDSSFWFGYLVRAILAILTSLLTILTVIAVLAALATLLLTIAAALAALDEVADRGIEVSRNAATDTVDTARRDTYKALGSIRNRARSVRRSHSSVPKRAPETTH
jgi:hypothetical protein